MPRFLTGVWFFLAALVFDQLAKVAARMSLGDDTPFASLPYISLLATEHPGWLAGWFERVDAGRSVALLVGLALLALFYLAGSRQRRAEGAEGPWWWLAAGAVAGNLADRARSGDVLDFLHLHLGDLTLSLNLSGILLGVALLALLGEMLFDLRAPRTLQVGLERPLPDHPGLADMRRGIDNVRIDVRLSPTFVAAARRLTQGLLYQQMGNEQYGARPAPPHAQFFNNFRTSYGQMLTSVARRAKNSGDHRLLVLMHFAVIKALREGTSAEFDRQLAKLRSFASTGMGSVGSRRMLLNSHITDLAHHRARVEMEARSALFEQLRRVEEGTGVRIRESLLGLPWVVAPNVLFNPLLQGDDPYDPATTLRHYTLLGKREADRAVLRRYEDFFNRQLRHAMPEPVAPAGAGDEPAEKSWLPGSFWEERAQEYGLADMAENPFSQLPDNVPLLCDPHHFDDARDQARGRGDRAEVRRLDAQRRFQLRLQRRLYRFAVRERLLGWIATAYEVVPVQRQYYPNVNPLLLMEYLAGGRGRRHALRQIRKATEKEGASSLQPLAYLRRRIRGLPRSAYAAYVVRFTRDLVAFRRDLRGYLQSQGAMERVRLIDDPESLRLSRDNGCLFELMAGDETVSQQAQVEAHVVVKADLRGSTTITRDLLARGLNPATHFDRHFFAPIRKLMETFGAEKVFVEGDAIIAMLVDEAGGSERLAVARACGLARRMIAVAQANDAELANHGLPALQTGIGIACEPGPPTFLYDGEQRITISSAIGRADRLSSSSWRLRAEGPGDDGHRVRVYALDRDHPQYGEKGETELRYNVGGIELERAGFERLGDEVDLRHVQLKLPGGKGGHARFHVARVPDATGSLHLLAIREAPILRYGLSGPGEKSDGRYYEVVADVELMRLVGDAFSLADG